MFKVGDIVEITDEAAATGMLDFETGKGYKVVDYLREGSYGTPCALVCLIDESRKIDWYAASHFKLKENTGADAVLEFGVGDTVEIVESSYDTGMMDFVLGKGYEVHDFLSQAYGRFTAQVLVKDESGYFMWCHPGHFKLHTKKEEEKVEKKECLFKEGQVVWDVVYGKGTVVEIAEYNIYPVIVQFSDETMAYSEDGKTCETHGRTLFFSEPKIEAATEPLFEPTLKKGDVVIAIDTTATSFPSHVFTVIEENVNFVKTEEFGVIGKERWDFYRLGEKIIFN